MAEVIIDWRREMVYQLISEVKSFECLYNPTSDVKRTLNSKVWKTIATHLNVPAFECKKKWRNLRDMYTSIRRKLGDRNGKPVKWEFYSAMSFLGSITNEMPRNGGVEAAISVDSNELESGEIAQSSKRKRFRGEIVANPTEADSGESEESIFGRFVAKSLAPLGRKAKVLAQLKIHQILAEFQLEQQQTELLSTSTQPNCSLLLPQNPSDFNQFL